LYLEIEGMQNKKLLSIGEASRYLGISRDTLRRWEKKEKIASLRSPTNRRYYTKEQLDKLISKPSETKKPIRKGVKRPGLLKVIIFAVVGFTLATIIVSILQILIL